MQTAAELRAQARHARALASNTFDPQLKKALLAAAEDFEEQAARIEQSASPTVALSRKFEG